MQQPGSWIISIFGGAGIGSGLLPGSIHLIVVTVGDVLAVGTMDFNRATIQVVGGGGAVIKRVCDLKWAVPLVIGGLRAWPAWLLLGCSDPSEVSDEIIHIAGFGGIDRARCYRHEIFAPIIIIVCVDLFRAGKNSPRDV